MYTDATQIQVVLLNKRVLNGGEYDIGRDYDVHSLNSFIIIIILKS